MSESSNDVFMPLKIGIMTLLQSDNYGAVLQAYALQLFLREEGHNPFFINFLGDSPSLAKFMLHPWASIQKFRNLGWTSFIPKRPSASSASHLQSVMSHFRAEHLNIKGEFFGYDELVQSPPEADAYVCGSDCVWAYDAFFSSPAYLLGFAPDNALRVAYAPSFGKGRLERYQWAPFRRYLDRFDAMSARESSGVKLLSDLGIQDVARVLDPTFLPSHYRDVYKVHEEVHGPYLLAYILNQERSLTQNAIDTIISVARRRELKIVWIATDYLPSDIQDFEVKQPCPGDFLRLIECASLIVTNSFHGCVFSVRYRRDFIC